MILPTIHLNGNSAQSLYDEYLAAFYAVGDAVEVVKKIDFNARNYYPQGLDAFDKARKEFAEHLQAMEKLREYLMAHAEHCGGFIK